jgi:hypothetical protein
LKYLDLIVYGIGIAIMGAGLAWKDPAIAAVVVGSVVSITVIGARIMGRPRRLAPRKETRTNEPA